MQHLSIESFLLDRVVNFCLFDLFTKLSMRTFIFFTLLVGHSKSIECLIIALKMKIYPGFKSFHSWKLLSPSRIILRHFLNYLYFRKCIEVALRLSKHLSMLKVAIKLETIRLDLFSFIIRNKIEENQEGLSIKVH